VAPYTLTGHLCYRSEFGWTSGAFCGLREYAHCMEFRIATRVENPRGTHRLDYGFDYGLGNEP
jgi:hypothetical protein